MTNAKLEALRAECARIMLAEDDELILECIIEEHKEAKKRPQLPRYTKEELVARIRKAEKDYAAGLITGVSTEEAFRPYEKWL